MVFAQFYQKSAIDKQGIVEACGDRAVIILDGRSSLQTNIDLTREECKKRGYVAYSLHRGDTFTRNRQITTVQYI